jgi:hypothetical protein
MGWPWGSITRPVYRNHRSAQVGHRLCLDSGMGPSWNHHRSGSSVIVQWRALLLAVISSSIDSGSFRSGSGSESIPMRKRIKRKDYCPESLQFGRVGILPKIKSSNSQTIQCQEELAREHSAKR